MFTDVDSAVKVLTVLVELLRLVLTVLQGKQWQREVGDTSQTAIGVSSSYLSKLTDFRRKILKLLTS